MSLSGAVKGLAGKMVTIELSSELQYTSTPGKDQILLFLGDNYYVDYYTPYGG